MPLKTDRSRRTLQMPEPIIERLKAHRRAQLESRLAAGKGWIDTGLVFTNSIGKPLDSANLRKRFKVLAKAIGVPRLRLHDLRHSCATLLLAQGVSERTIMEILGHSQISLTLNTYTHVLDTAKKDAAARMVTVLASAGSEQLEERGCSHDALNSKEVGLREMCNANGLDDLFSGVAAAGTDAWRAWLTIFGMGSRRPRLATPRG